MSQHSTRPQKLRTDSSQPVVSHTPESLGQTRQSFCVDVTPSVLAWALRRSERDADMAAVLRHQPKFPGWRDGTIKPTYRQLEDFATWTNIPLGWFLLPTPPQESLPSSVVDFRTLDDEQVKHPSGGLLDVFYVCRARQHWYRQHALTNGWPPLNFVGSLKDRPRPTHAASTIRDAIGWPPEGLRRPKLWDDALTQLTRRIEALGVLVMIAATVEGRQSFRLNEKEFRGFSLADPLAPLIFVNSNDARTAQMFTLAHELAHIFAGDIGLSNATVQPSKDEQPIERWCNEVAAELLVPLEQLTAQVGEQEINRATLRSLAKDHFVSTLVIVRRLLDAKIVSRAKFGMLYAAETKAFDDHQARNSGGFAQRYASFTKWVSPRFASALIQSTQEGDTTATEALKLLRLKSLTQLDKLAGHLERTER